MHVLLACMGDHFSYHIGCGCLHSSEKQEQSQGKGNAQVEVNKVMELLNQLFSVAIQRKYMT